MVEKFLALMLLLSIVTLFSLLFIHTHLAQSTRDPVSSSASNEHRCETESIDDPYPFRDPDASQNKLSPKVAWLMSYPNSGTSYTMKLVGQASNRSTATNYGLECKLDRNGENIPLYSFSPGGPYISNSDKDLPDHYILTKTHCGGRCVDCGPGHYLETKESFMGMCVKGSHFSSTNMTKVHTQYNLKLAQRAIHLIRNPFNNIVSNFHLERHENIKKKRHAWLEMYPNNANGFREWCRNIDTKYSEEEDSSRLIPGFIINMFEGIPCHKSFYAFAQWHNLAIRVIQELKLPYIIIHYEDFEINFNTTATKIFEFLDFEPIGKIPLFTPGKQYQEYFLDSEQKRAKQLVRNLADPQSWDYIGRYF